MITKQEVEKTLVFDIETVSNTRHFHQLDDRLQKLWREKKVPSIKLSNPQDSNLSDDTLYLKYAPLSAEFGRVICVSFVF